MKKRVFRDWKLKLPETKKAVVAFPKLRAIVFHTAVCALSVTKMFFRRWVEFQ